MKKITSLALLTLFAFSAFAQLEQTVEEKPVENKYRTLKHSLSIGIVGGGELADQFYPMPGLGYKYFTPNGAFRAMLGGIYNSTASSSGGGVDVTDSDAAMNLRLGYQYHVMLGRFMPTLGVDLAGGILERRMTGWGNSITKSSTIGISPNLGLEFWFNEKLSVFIDTRFDIMYRDFYNSSEWSDGWGGPQISEVRVKGIQTHISPISSFMAAFHF